jgi:very-short-patch-repair endonuclease
MDATVARGGSPSPLAGEGARLGGVPPSRSGRGGMPSKELLLARAKWMRANPTDAEKRLWSILRAKRLSDYKFKRQVIIDWYIADFVNFERRVIVEADGSQHADNKYDERRDAYLKSQGFKMIRFWNRDALKDSHAVAETIWSALQQSLETRVTPHPSDATRLPPSPARGEGF